ncbi:hypothetical protein, partial [Haladaptatus sp. W1]|uniref:hypothetical protein n=1 Tax=Haladaptatus sp. W1 TaxID=1897478 RepID=UPI001C2F2CB1
MTYRRQRFRVHDGTNCRSVHTETSTSNRRNQSPEHVPLAVPRAESVHGADENVAERERHRWSTVGV